MKGTSVTRHFVLWPVALIILFAVAWQVEAMSAEECERRGGTYYGNGMCAVVPDDAKEQCERKGGTYYGSGMCAVPSR